VAKRKRVQKQARLDERAAAERWDTGMRHQANTEASLFEEEVARLQAGLASLENDGTLRHALALALAILALALAALGAFAWAQITARPPEPIHFEGGSLPPLNRC